MSGGADENDGRDQQDQPNQQDQHGQQNQQNQQGQQNQGPGTAEKVMTTISVVVTVLLFGYVAWHAVQPPTGATPEAQVVGTEALSNGSILVRAELTNPSHKGLISATVEASCGQPPPSTSLSYVPAGGREQAVLVCPPNTTDPSVSVSAWVPA